MNFEIKGTFVQKGIETKFSKTIDAINEKNAKEKTLTQVGSQHGLKRRNVVINSIQEIKGE